MPAPTLMTQPSLDRSPRRSAAASPPPRPAHPRIAGLLAPSSGLGRSIAVLRSGRGRNQRQLAAAAGVFASAISDYELDKTQPAPAHPRPPARRARLHPRAPPARAPARADPRPARRARPALARPRPDRPPPRPAPGRYALRRHLPPLSVLRRSTPPTRRRQPAPKR